jgi:cytochrome b pre-mRNA-processing protein 3
VLEPDRHIPPTRKPTPMLQRLFRKKSIKIAARAIYDQLSAAAREPRLYGPGRVADSPDGRFELLALHSAILFSRLSKRGEQADETAQEVFDILFSAMDHALRELGVGDISVGKRIRKLAESFYGRMAVYNDALAQGEAGKADLATGIGVHVLEQADGDHPYAGILATRALSWTAMLASQSDEDLLSGKLPSPIT